MATDETRDDTPLPTLRRAYDAEAVDALVGELRATIADLGAQLADARLQVATVESRLREEAAANAALLGRALLLVQQTSSTYAKAEPIDLTVAEAQPVVTTEYFETLRRSLEDGQPLGPDDGRPLLSHVQERTWQRPRINTSDGLYMRAM